MKHFSCKTAEIRGWTGCCTQSVFRTTISCYRRMCSSIVGCLSMKICKCRTAVICLMKSLYAVVQTFSSTSRLQWQSQDGRTEASGCFLNIVFFFYFLLCIHVAMRSPSVALGLVPRKKMYHRPFWFCTKWYTNASVSYQSLVNAAMVELDMAEDATTRDGSMYENGVVWTSGRRQTVWFFSN